MASINGTKYSDTLTGTAGDDFFDSKGGNDIIDGLDGNDTLLIFEDSTEFELSTLAGVTKLTGTGYAGDYAYYTATMTNVEQIQFTDTTVTLTTTDDSVITGTRYSDTLTGTAGDDFFDSKGGNDIIDGLDGNDTLLIFEDSTEFELSTLAGVTKLTGTGYAGDYAYYTATMTNVEQIQFTDTTVTLTTTDDSVITGTRYSDTLTGTAGDDFFDSKGGNDIIDGLDGNDTLLIFEDSTEFELSTLAGVTKLTGTGYAGDYAYYTATMTNVEQIQFTDTTVTLTTTDDSVITGTRYSDTLTGTAGDDFFDSKGGNDIIDGLDGNDTLLIFEDSTEFELSTLAGVTKLTGTGYAGDYAYYTATMTNVEQIQFTDATVTLTTTDDSVITGTRYSDTLTGTAGDDFFDSKGGNDIIDGLDGNDTLLIFEDSTEFELSTLAGVTKLTGTGYAGDYAYYTATMTNVEQIQFTDATVTLTTTDDSVITGTRYSDTLTGTAGDDFFDSKGGNDIIDGLDGNDTLLIFEDSTEFELSTLAGVTKLTGTGYAGDYAYYTATMTNVEQIQFTDTTVTLTTTDDSVITGTRYSDTLTGTAGDDFFDSKGGNDIIDGLDGNDTLLIFEDSTEFELSTLAGVTKLTGTGYAGDYAYDTATMTNVEQIQFTDTTVTLTTTDDSVITGTRYSDTLTGTAGDDFFDSKGGNDIIDGLDGNDTLLIFEDSTEFELSTLAGVTKLTGTGYAGDYAYDTATMTNVEQIQFTDTTVTLTTTDDSVITGTRYSDTLTGTAGDDFFDSKGGNDIIDGLDGNDTLLIFEDSTEFELSTLAGVTKLTGTGYAGDYAYDTVYPLHIENIQFNNKLTSIVSSPDNLILGSRWTDNLNGTESDDIFDTWSGNDVINGDSGRDLLVLHASSDAFTIMQINSSKFSISGDYSAGDYAYSYITVDQVEEIQFTDQRIELIKPKVLISTSSITLDESSSDSHIFTIQLTKEPTDDVVISMTQYEDISLDKQSVTFTAQNWTIPQEITVSVIDDNIVEGVEQVYLSFTVNSLDLDYEGKNPDNMLINIIDNDIADNNSISGLIWNDTNRDQQFDEGEQVLSGWTVYLDQNNNLKLDVSEVSTVTDDTGNYTFHNLPTGTYAIHQVIESGYSQTTPRNQFDHNIEDGVNNLTINKSISLTSIDENYHDYYQSLIGVDYANNQQYDGSGYTVVILDTGIDLNHEHFGDDENSDSVADKILVSLDFTGSAPTGEDGNGHGTHVAGIIASSDSVYPGVAPGASIISLKVLTDGGRGSFDSVNKALNWSIENAEKYNIVSLNMSLGDGTYAEEDIVKGYSSKELAALEAIGVCVVSASGNGYSTQTGVSYPSSDISSWSIGASFHSDVGSAYGAYTSNADVIAPFSQRDDELTTIFAPGVFIPAARVDGGVVQLSGTSMAAPVVAGLVAIIQDAAVDLLGSKLNPDEVEELIIRLGVDIIDGDDENDSVENTFLSFKRIDIESILGELEAMAGPGGYSVTVLESENIDGIDFGVSQSSSKLLVFDDKTVGSVAADVISVSSQTNLNFFGGLGNDIFITEDSSSSSIHGGDGSDTVIFNSGLIWSNGYVARNVSNESSVGTGEKIALGGFNRFSDVIDGGADVDTLNLTTGNDAFFIDDVYSAHHSSLTLSSTTQGVDSTARMVELETINAGEGNDIVDLTSTNFVLATGVTINGEAGNDNLWGSNGNDTIDGGTGDDSIFGGTGSDTLTGGTGADAFQFTATAGSDVITDFDVSGDSIKLYYRAEDNHTNANLSLANGVLTWNVDSTSNDVVIGLSATTNSSDLIDLDALITFVEII